MRFSWMSADRRWVLGLVLLGVGVVAVISGIRVGGDAPDASPRPDKGGTPPVELTAPRAAASSDELHEVARPAWVSIPSIGVRSQLLTLGIRTDGMIEVPSMAEADQAGWYRYSPRPGETGPAVVVGHVDSTDGAAVFYRLGELTPGTPIEVGRTDGSVVRFRVRGVEAFAKAEFPTERVYGNTAGPELRLITCGGAYDSTRGGYQDNVVVFASLAASS